MAVLGSTSDGAAIGVDVVVYDTGAGAFGKVVDPLGLVALADGVVAVNVNFGLPNFRKSTYIK